MEITKVKYWTKVVKQNTVDHIKISYKYSDGEFTVHKFGENDVAAPEFYAAFEDFSPIICKLCGLKESMASAFSLREISIANSEDKEGNDNSEYTMVYSLKTGHANTTIKTTINHKFLPEGFAEAIGNIVDEAEEYLNGKRSQTMLDLKTEPEEEN